MLKLHDSRGLNSRTKLKGWLFLSPFLIGFALYFCAIITTSIVYSFSNNTLTQQGLVSKFNGIANYNYALRVDPQFIQLLVSAVSQFLTNTPVILIFSLFIAVILNQNIKGRTAFRAIFFIPVILATGLIDKIDMNNDVLNNLSNLSGISTGGLATATKFFSYANIEQLTLSLNLNAGYTSYILSAVNNIISIVNLSGVQILIFLSGLQSISPSIYESAQVEGASGWECFWKITIPMLSPMILVNLFYSVIDYFTRTSSPMMNYISDVTFNSSKYGDASAMSWIYFVSIAVILAVIALLVRRFIFYEQKD